MAPPRKKLSVALSQVPSVKELCNRLGFERATQAETTVFTDTTHAFRKSYKCSNGSAGSTLTEWNSISVQQELAAMAMEFLDEGGNGERFWSDSRRWKDDGDLMYPEDRRIIADYLKQLFWKQNKYSLNNQNYIERKVNAAQDQLRDNTTPTQETTQRASIASTATLKLVDMQERRYPGREANSRAAEPKGPVISLLEEDRNEILDQIQSTLPTNVGRAGRTDIFDFPEDDSDAARNPPIVDYASHRPPVRTPTKTSPHSGVEKSPGSKKTSPSTKRPRIGEKDRDKNQKKRKLISPRRMSDRPKAPRKIPETVPDEILDSLLRIKPSDKRPTSAAEHAMHRLSDQPRQTSTTESTYDTTEPSTIQTNMQRETYSHPADGSSLGGGKRGPGAGVPVAPMLGISAVRDGGRPSRTFSIPSSISEPQTPVQQPSDAALTPDPTLKPRPKVRGAFWIVTSPDPNYSEESWNNGQIKGKSLSTVIEEISSITSRDCIEKLKIKLKTSFAQTTTTVHKDAEDHWEIAKHNLEDKIKEAFTRDRNQQTHFQIWIEPLYEQNAPLGGNDDAENGEIDW